MSDGPASGSGSPERLPRPRPPGESLSTYRYRAIVNGDSLTLRPLSSKLVTGGPAGHLLRGPERAGVAIADVRLHESDGAYESVVTLRTPELAEVAERRLVDWAAHVGHRRIWIRDRMIDLEDRLPAAGAVSTTCPCCLASWHEDLWDFWSQVRDLGHFPCACPICGTAMPQWTSPEQPETRDDRSWEDELEIAARLSHRRGLGMTEDIELRDRYRGAMLGLAVGDALGTTVEFASPGSFELVTDMVGGGPFGLPAGAWTDDTSMALCLAESLVEQETFDPEDQLRRYVRWYRDGHLSSTGRCFDIGNATRAALERFERTGEPYPGDTYPDAAGNGGLMRLAPIPLAYAHDPQLAMTRAAQSTRTTHGAPQAIDASRYFGSLIVRAVRGEAKHELIGDSAEVLVDALHPDVLEVGEGSFRRRHPPQIRGKGYVVPALEAALWAFSTTDTFEEGALAAVNLGDDADTTAAIYGQLAGAMLGVEAIPARWRDTIVMREEITSLADGLLALSQQRLA